MSVQYCARYIASLVAMAGVLGFPSATQADIVHNDDVIIDGSLNVGLDAVNGKAFGFDTIILSENNLRIRFEDTSVVPSFPSNDWRLIANDSSNGGANYFAIEDIDGGSRIFRVNAGAPESSLLVDDTGHIGLGTSNPSVDLHILSGNSPTVRLAQDGSQGFAPQTWDVSGNETNFFIRDATNGSQLPFRIRPNAPTNALFVESNGDVAIGSSSPQADLHVRRTTGAAEIRIEASDAATMQARLSLQNNTQEFQLINNGNRMQWFDITNGFEAFTIRATTGRAGFMNLNPGHPIEVGSDATNGNGAHVTVDGMWTNGSSRKNKEGIKDLDDQAALAALQTLNPVTFYGKDSTSGEQYVGFIAEDVPELVAMNGRKGIAAIEIAAVITKVVKRQQQTIAELQKQVARLEAVVKSDQ